MIIIQKFIDKDIVEEQKRETVICVRELPCTPFFEEIEGLLLEDRKDGLKRVVYVMAEKEEVDLMFIMKDLDFKMHFKLEEKE